MRGTVAKRLRRQSGGKSCLLPDHETIFNKCLRMVKDKLTEVLIPQVVCRGCRDTYKLAKKTYKWRKQHGYRTG